MARVGERLRRLASAARESAEVAQADRSARDAAIEEADADGWNLPAIAREVDMSVSHVQRIVIAATARRQDRERERPETD
jgi:AraC-like DNA-binding protein